MGAVVQEVFGYLMRESGFVERTRSWLGRDPRRLAFQVALSRTYATFARHYPQWTAQLFDEHFLRGRAVPLLARCLEQGDPPDPAELTEAWADQLGLTGYVRERHLVTVTPVSAAFLGWLEKELRAQDEFRPLFEGRILDSIVESSAQTEHAVQQLRQDLQATLTRAAEYRTPAHQAQATSDNADATAVSRVFFGGDYATLEEFYLSPDEVFERVQVGDFVGRTWLEGDLDAFLGSNDRGAWLLVGEAGIGKTSFLAHLARERGYPHFFAEQAPGDSNLPRALQSIAAQLISRFRLEPYVGRNTLPHELNAYPDFVARLLRDAARKLGASERLVIVLDALDEAGVAPGGNVLGLPRQLPKGVYLVLSQRSEPVPLSVEPMPHRADLRAGEPDNQRDVASYLRSVVADPTVLAHVRARGYSADDFVHVLGEKSAGNWMYLRYVVDEIRRGRRSPLELSTLPQGLVGYYAEYWGRWRERSRWDSFYAPLLTTLAVALEPVSLEKLRRWSGVDVDDHALRRLLRERWSAFVQEVGGAESRYRPYHLSLREFLAGEQDPECFPPNVEGLLRELRERAEEAHRRISRELRRGDGGDASPLAEDFYAQRHLTTHLRLAGEREALFSLVEERDWYDAQSSRDPSAAAYLNDLAQAWEAAEAENAEAARLGRPAPLLGREMRYALATASLLSASHRIPPELLTALVDSGLWTPAQALVVARQTSERNEKAELLLNLALRLPEVDRMPVIREALDAAKETELEYWRPSMLAAVAHHLPEAERPPIMREALATAGHQEKWDAAFRNLAPYLSQDQLLEALDAARTIGWNKYRQANALKTLAGYLTGEASGEALFDALAAAEEVDEPGHRAMMLVDLASDLPEAVRDDVLNKALDAAQTAEDASGKATVLSELINHAPQMSAATLLEEAFEVARSIEHAVPRVSRTAALSAHLPSPEREEVLRESLEAARAIDEGRLQVSALRAVARHLPAEQRSEVVREAVEFAQALPPESHPSLELWSLASELSRTGLPQEALAAARSIREPKYRSEALTAAAQHLPDPVKKEVLREAFDAGRVVGDFVRLAEALSDLVDCLPEGEPLPLLGEDLETVREIEKEIDRAKALVYLAPGLPEDLTSEFLTLARNIDDASGRAPALVAVLPRLPESDRPDVWKEALDDARSIRQAHGRAETLAQMASRMPEAQCAAVMREALRVAQELPEAESQGFKSPRADALVSVARYLTGAERSSVLREALLCSRKIEADSLSQPWIRELLHEFPEDEVVVGMALGIARDVADNYWRAVALWTVAEHLTDGAKPEVLREALEAARAIDPEMYDPFGLQRPRALAALAEPLAAAGHPEAALAIARALDDVGEKAEAMAGTVPHLPEAERESVLREAHELALTLENDAERGKALAAMVPHLLRFGDSSALAEVLRTAPAMERRYGGPLQRLATTLSSQGFLKAALDVALTIERSGGVFSLKGRSGILMELAEPLARVARADLYPLWRDALHSLAAHYRAELAGDLSALSPVLLALGDEVAVLRLTDAILKSKRWWP